MSVQGSGSIESQPLGCTANDRKDAYNALQVLFAKAKSLEGPYTPNSDHEIAASVGLLLEHIETAYGQEITAEELINHMKSFICGVKDCHRQGLLDQAIIFMSAQKSLEADAGNELSKPEIETDRDFPDIVLLLGKSALL